MKTRVVALLFCLLVVAFLAVAQTSNGTITGVVSDPAGAVVAGANIEVRNIDTGFVYPAQSTGTGNYTVSQLPPGPYSVTVKVSGFKTFNRTGLTIAAATTLPIDIRLEVGAATDSVTVNAEGTLLKTESGDLATNITVSSLDNLPILGVGTSNSGSSGVRNPFNMLQLIPGVGNYTANSVMVINGLGGPAYTTESFRIEGLDSTNHLPTGYAVQENQPSADAIQEVAIQTSNYAAEFGTAGAAVLNMTMKSGTNAFHGTAYDYFVNEDLNAGLPFSISGGPGSPTGGDGGKYRPRNRRNDFGGTFGGPVWIPKVYNGRNKTFFFFNEEIYKENNLYSFPLTVPTAAYRTGDFSAISANGTCSACAQNGIQSTPLGVPTAVVDPLGRPIYANEIYDPLTRGVATNGLGYANPFPNNQIPLTRLDPTALKIQALFPTATTASLTNNASGSILGHRDSSIPALKIDHLLTAKDKLSFYYSKTSTESQIAFPFGNADGLPVEIGQYRGTFIYGTTYRLNYDRTLTPTMLLHLGMGFGRTNFGDQAPFLTFNPSDFGLSGFLIHRQFPTVAGLCASAFLSNVCNGAGGMQTIGTSGQIQTFNRETRPAFNGTLTYVRGNHTFKAGAEISYQGNLFANFAGVTLTATANQIPPFNYGATAQPFTPVSGLNGFTQGFGYANFLLGDYTSTSQTPQIDYRIGKSQYAFFLQDTWKVTRRLTVDYGIRYDFSTPAKETYGRLGKFAAALPDSNAGGRLGATQFANTCNCDFYGPSYPYALGPRVGVAYQINEKTVLRGGWGVVYQYTPDGAAGGIVSTNAINSPAGINSFVNTQSAGFIQPAVWPVTNPGVFPNLGTQTGAPAMYDNNYNRPPRQNQYSIGLQREITGNLVVEASFVANRQVWVPIGGIASGPLGYLNQIPASTYAKYGLYPYPGTGPAGYAYSAPGLVCNPGNDCDRALLSQPVSAPAVMAKMAAAGIGNGGLLLPYATFPTSASLQTALRPYPQFPSLAPTGSPTGDERYDSLQAKLTKRLSHGLQASGAFTFEKSFLRGAPQDFFNPTGSQWALQNLPPRILTFNVTYTTPRLSYLDAHAKWLNPVIKDWQIGFFANYQSGTFLTPPTSSTTTFLTGQEIRVPGQPLYLKDINSHGINPYYDQVLNPAAWQNVPVNGVGPSSTVLYTDFRGPRHPQENMNLARNFKLTERFNLQIRGEFVNIFNRTLLPNPVTNVNSTVALSRNSLGILTNGFGVMQAYLTPNSQPTSTTSAQNGGAALAGRSGTLVMRLSF
jgi:hypothetical protein